MMTVECVTLGMMSVVWWCSDREPFQLQREQSPKKHKYVFTSSCNTCLCVLCIFCWNTNSPFVFRCLYSAVFCRHHSTAITLAGLLLEDLTFFHFLHKRLRICNRFFTHLLYVFIHARLQISIQLSLFLTKLCHIKRDYPVHIICSKCSRSAETHTLTRLRKLLIALLVVVCDK